MEQYECIIADLGYYNSEKSVLIEVNEDSDKIEISTEIDGINIFICDEYYFATYGIMQM